MHNKFMRSRAVIVTSVVVGNASVSCSSNAWWLEDTRVSVIDAICYVNGFKEIKELKLITKPLRIAHNRMMEEFKKAGNGGNTNNLFDALHEYNELEEVYGWAEEALDAVRSECVERMSWNKSPGTSIKGKFFCKDLGQKESRTI